MQGLNNFKITVESYPSDYSHFNSDICIRNVSLQLNFFE
jgi:hypothetical protein